MNSKALPLGALVAALGVFFIYISPMYTVSIAGVNARIAEEQAALDAAARFHAKESELKAAQEAIAVSDLERLETFIPNSIDNVGVILDLTALAERSGVQLSSINVAPSPTSSTEGDAEASSVGSIEMTLSATGTYQAFRTFMASIEKSARLLDIINLTVSGSDTGVYGYALSVRLYWLR